MSPVFSQPSWNTREVPFGILVIAFHDLRSARVDFALASATLVPAGAVRVEDAAGFEIDDSDFCLRVERVPPCQ